jgi:hypothetical protein
MIKSRVRKLKILFANNAKVQWHFQGTDFNF